MLIQAVRVYREQNGQREEVPWRALATPEDLANHVNTVTSRVYSRTRWPEWWAMRSSRRLPMEPWAQDLAAAFVLRRLLQSGGSFEVEGASPTLRLLLTMQEQARIRFVRCPSPTRVMPWVRMVIWVLKKVRNRFLLRKLSKPWLSMKQCDLLLHTVVIPESISPDGRLNDMFFPEVQMEAEARGRRVFTLGFAPALPSGARRWKRLGSWGLLDEVIGIREFRIVSERVKALAQRIRGWTGDIDDLPEAWLKARWMDDLQQSEFFEAVAAGEWAGDFCRNRKVGVFMYSFERKTFEQAMLQAVHSESPSTRTCAYQNAALTNKHYHNWGYTGGVDVVPGLIMTVGEITTSILTGPGQYDPGRVRIGGALRQRSLLERQVLRRPIQNLLVIWAEGREQYEKFWSFLKQAWDESDLSRFHFRIRPHPAIPFEFPGGENYAGRYEVDPLTDVRHSIDWADAILYASTSLAIIAAASGIPVLSIRLHDYFDDDCIPAGGKMLHWRVEKPSDLVRTLTAIDEMYDDDFDEYLAGSKQFAAQYFHRATTETFLRTAGVLSPVST